MTCTRHWRPTNETRDQTVCQLHRFSHHQLVVTHPKNTVQRNILSTGVWASIGSVQIKLKVVSSVREIHFQTVAAPNIKSATEHECVPNNASANHSVFLNSGENLGTRAGTKCDLPTPRTTSTLAACRFGNLFDERWLMENPETLCKATYTAVLYLFHRLSPFANRMCFSSFLFKYAVILYLLLDYTFNAYFHKRPTLRRYEATWMQRAR